ncbi:MAG TPA: shikimate dehydrogenase [Planctomycetota bacterium]|nr:shikimate dehydrogenase [Planctomycetota bacterium]
MICISLTSTDLDKLHKDMSRAAKLADVIEVRLDYLPDNIDIGAVLAGRPKPVIVTCRRVEDGGLYDSDDRVRISQLIRAAALGAEYIDIELDAAREVRDVHARRIVSYHNFKSTPQNLADVQKQAIDAGADIVKIAVMANSQDDNLRVFDLLKKSQVPTAAFCMGELGTISRILGRKFGSRITYAALDRGLESAPGQLAAAELRELYRYHKIGPETAVYGVIANPVAHSMSPAIHNAAFSETGIDAIYLPFKVDEPVSFVNAFKAIDVQGYSVTIPHKETIMPAMDEIDATARKIGAINTVVNRGGRLFGYNTDYIAAVGELEKATELRGRKALMIGAGGGARAIAFGLVQKGVKLTVTDIASEKAQKLADDVHCSWDYIDHVRAPEVDILLNATPIGMHPKTDESPVPADWLRPETVVFDIVYNPIETRLLREARRRGCKTVSGFDMFVSQAVAQFELWTGRKAPVATMADVVRRRLTQQ